MTTEKTTNQQLFPYHYIQAILTLWAEQQTGPKRIGIRDLHEALWKLVGTWPEMFAGITFDCSGKHVISAELEEVLSSLVAASVLSMPVGGRLQCYEVERDAKASRDYFEKYGAEDDWSNVEQATKTFADMYKRWYTYKN
ncbi:MAG: hypothetical protein WCV85_00135 [Patescibacteria group bacterium]|jgi:hypothetical protein